MSFTIRTLSTSIVVFKTRWWILVSLLMIAPVSIAMADQTSTAANENATQSVQSPALDPITGLDYGAQLTVSGVAMAVDAEGHPRALCADPTDSLAPLQLRDAIDPANSRLRYE